VQQHASEPVDRLCALCHRCGVDWLAAHGSACSRCRIARSCWTRVQGQRQRAAAPRLHRIMCTSEEQRLAREPDWNTLEHTSISAADQSRAGGQIRQRSSARRQQHSARRPVLRSRQQGSAAPYCATWQAERPPAAGAAAATVRRVQISGRLCACWENITLPNSSSVCKMHNYTGLISFLIDFALSC